MREAEIVAELALQMEQTCAEAMAGGASVDEAERLARAQLRDWASLASEINDAECAGSSLPSARKEVFSGALADLRYATRFLGRNPLFSAIAVGTLTFGIGANTAIFTMVDALVLRSLPYRDSGHLMAIETRRSAQPDLEAWTSALDFFDFRESAQSFSALAAISGVWNLVMTGRGEAERLETLFVSAEFFPLLGVSPALGRSFRPEEDRRGQPSNVVMLSHSLWQRRFGGGREVLGASIALDNRNYSVIGVLPPGFRYAGEPLAGTVSEIDIWLPLSANPIVNSIRGVRFLKVIGRLKLAATEWQAREEASRIGDALSRQYPDSDRGYAIYIQPLHTQVTGRLRLTVWLLLGTVGFVLLMACANVANLLLFRAAARGRELAVRAALGASRFRILRQLMAEGTVLACAGGVMGLLVAHGGLRFLLAVAPASMVGSRAISLNSRALLVTIGAVAACALLAGLPPAWRIVRADIEAALRQGGRGLTSGHHRLRSALVVTQVAVALLLLVGAMLLIRSFQRLLDVDPGFQARNLITISTQMPPSARTPEQRAAALRLVRDRLAAVPGVRSTAAVSRLPMLGSNLYSWMFVEGRSRPGEPGYETEYRVATPGYFETMGIPLRAGRVFDARDEANPAGVIVISETAARRFWPGRDPVGARIKLGANPETQPWITVIGVTGDVRHEGLDIEPQATIFRPYAHNPLSSPILVVRTSADAASLVHTLASIVRSASVEMPAYNVFPMQVLVDRSTAQRRFAMWLLTGFAVAALLLAGVGVYGTMSQSVSQRNREIGLRMALGASPAAALRLVFEQGLRLAVAGIAIGMLGAGALTRLMRRMLFEIRPLDPVAFLIAAAVLGGFAALACYVPARRATRVDPLITLREDC